jgi:uncharacterized protein (DUF1501 family)
MTDDTPKDPRSRPRWDAAPPATPSADMPLGGPPKPSRLEMPPGPASPPPAPPTPPTPTTDAGPTDSAHTPAATAPFSRRKFIGVAGGVAGVAVAGGAAWAALVRDSVDESASRLAGVTTTLPPTTLPATTLPATTTTLGAGSGAGGGERVLVVLEMAGGNDALNTLVPGDGRYRDRRPTLAIGESDLVALSGVGYSLHPALGSLASYFERGSMLAVAGSGMTEQSRSHFKAMDTWWSGVPGGTSQTGWLGRWLDATLEGDNDPLKAIALGGGGPSLVGLNTISTVVRSPELFSLRTMEGADNDALVAAFLATSQPLSSEPFLANAQFAVPSTLSAVELLASVSGGGEADPVDVGRGNQSTASTLLQTAAGIIDLGIGTRVITVGISGFDTHANETARHDDLLSDVGEGIAAFLARLEADGNTDRVMLMTTSEFGRRASENGSGGTDHGNGGCQFLFGPEVAGGQIVGDLDLANLVNGDLPTVVDTLSVYAAALDWLGGPTDDVLGGTYDRLGLLSA